MSNKLLDYEVLSVIGTGSNGTCYKVKNKLTNKLYVWKSIDLNQLTEIKKKLILTEINLLRKLKHKNIVEYYDHIIDKNTKILYLIMECCDGGDLLKLIKKCQQNKCHLDEEFIWKILYQISKALQCCHLNTTTNNNITILHRDIKPANIFLDLDGNIKLGDFGLARILSENDEFAETLVGTPYYMSPEIIKGKKYNRKSDIWSLGCLIYELCALKTPFTGYKFEQLSENITNGLFERIPKLYSNDLQKIIEFMLSVDHDYRPTIEIILHHPTVISNLSISTETCYPCFIVDDPDKSIIKKDVSIKETHYNFNPNTDLTSTINQTDNLLITTPALRNQIFNSVKRRIFPTEFNSDPECYDEIHIKTLHKTKATSDIITKIEKYDHPNQVTQDIFSEALKQRLIAIRSRETDLKNKENNLKEQERNLMKKEKQLNKQEKILKEKVNLRQIRNEKKIINNYKKRPISYADSCFSIEPNESINTTIVPTCAKFNPDLIPRPKILQNKVTFKSPQKFKNYNIENIPPSISTSSSQQIQQKYGTMKYTQKDLENAVQKNYDTISTAINGIKLNQNQISSTVKTTETTKTDKRKSIFSLFSLNNKNNNDKEIDINKNKIHVPILKSSSSNDERTSSVDTFSSSSTNTMVSTKWNRENKKAAFEMLAILNQNDNKKDILIIDDKIIKRDRKRKSMILYRKNTNL